MYLTVEEVAKILNLCTQTIRNLIKKKKITAIKPSGGKRSPWRIHEAELEKFLVEQFEDEENREKIEQ